MKNPILSAMKLVVPSISNLNILHYGIAENNTLRVTDLDHELIIYRHEDVPVPVLFDALLYIKSGDLPAAIAAAKNEKVDDFPVAKVIGAVTDKIAISLPTDLGDFIPALKRRDKYAAKQGDHSVLAQVALNATEKEIVAADGYILFKRTFLTRLKKSFLIDEKSLRVAALFYHKIDGVFLTGEKDKLQVTLAAASWRLMCKATPFADYPNYQKVLPDRKEAVIVTWSEALIAEMKFFIEKSRPFFVEKINMVHFTRQEGIVKNRKLSYLQKTDFSAPLFALDPQQVIAFDAVYLEKALKFIKGPCAVTVGKNMTDTAIFTAGRDMVVLCPIRSLQCDVTVTRDALLSNEG